MLVLLLLVVVLLVLHTRRGGSEEKCSRAANITHFTFAHGPFAMVHVLLHLPHDELGTEITP